MNDNNLEWGFIIIIINIAIINIFYVYYCFCYVLFAVLPRGLKVKTSTSQWGHGTDPKPVEGALSR